MKSVTLWVAAAVVLGSGVARGQSISDGGSLSPLVVSTAVAGSEPDPVVVGTSTYRAKANKKNPQKITGRLDANMPAGLSLMIELEPTSGATSSGPVTLSTTARDLVTNMTNNGFETHPITYTLQATVAAGVVPLGSRTVTLTISAWP
jgi:hypothetical protein